MGECNLSRREIRSYQFFPGERPSGYGDCFTDRESVEQSLRPEHLDGQKGLSALEQLCFNASWGRLSKSMYALHVDDLEPMKQELTNSWRRLQTTPGSPQYVEVKFDFHQIGDELGLTFDSFSLLEQGVLALIRGAFGLSNLSCDRRRLIIGRTPEGAPHTTITITDTTMAVLLLRSDEYRLRSIFDHLYPEGPLARQDEIEELRKDYKMPEATREELLLHDLQERSIEIFYRIKQWSIVGYTFWRDLDHYLSADGSEFGNPTRNEKVFVFLPGLLTEIPGGQCGEASDEFLQGLATAIADVSVHELGHAFGLPHEGERPGVMAEDTPRGLHTTHFNDSERAYLQAIFGD